MYSESLITLLDPAIIGEDPGSSSTFWISPDGRIVAQHFHPPKPVFYRPHTHSEYNVMVCLEGAVEKTQLGSAAVIVQGEALVCNCGVEHSSNYMFGSAGCGAISLVIDQRLMADLLARCSIRGPSDLCAPIFMGKINSPVLYACALDFVEELRQQKRGHQLVLGTLALRMLVEALRCWPRANLEYGEIDTTPRLPRRDFIRVYEFMTWCRKDAFRLEQLCRFLGSSEERFTRLFRAATNTSPANFYNRMLLERGRDLLVDPSMSVKEISYTLGFRTTSHFVASFHREFGAPPAKYRANGGDNDSLC